jgi:hypothetical protein
MTLNDPEKHRGRSVISHTNENFVLIEGLIREGRRVKVREIAKVTGTAKSTVHEIIRDLNFHKMSACWFQTVLTEEHNSKGMASSHQNLCCYQDEGESFLESIITGDEIWIHEFTPESERNSIIWKHPHSSIIKKLRIEPS